MGNPWGTLARMVGSDAKELTPLGELILRRMAEIGMQRQNELAARSGIADSTISRLLHTEQRRAHIPTLRKLAEGLDLDANALVAFVYDGDPTEPVAGPHPLAAEIARMLAADSPLPVGERDLLVVLLDRVVAPVRPLMRRGAEAG